MKKIILASASPRRKELMEQMGLEFDICPASGEEVIKSENPADAAKELSLQKTSEIAAQSEEDAIVIGADTIVVFENKIMGKPRSEKDAFHMLTLLQGKTHSVYTGVSLVRIRDKKTVTFAEETKVTLYPVDAETIRNYIKTKEPMDKAGAYAIQGSFAVHIQKIYGEYSNVVGLPVARLYHELKKFGL